MAEMKTILDLVRTGRLGDATDKIQSLLRGSPTGTFQEEMPMRDVTPVSRALPDGAPSPKPKRGKAVRPRRAVADTGMVRETGLLPYRLFSPSTPSDDAPLIVMLHGCTQTPEDFAAGTRMNAAAEAIGAHVIWPEQSRAANANGCWNWFEPYHQGRAGEAAAIVSVVGDVLARIGGTRKVHVAGLSAGGAMAAILGAHYPEVFASVGIHSGLPVGSAQDVMSAFGAMRSGGDAVLPLAVPAIVFHGTADSTVAPVNGASFLPPDMTDADRSEVTANGRRVTVSRAARRGQTLATELWQVEGLGHAWSGGHHSGSYADPAGPDATAEMVRFFREASTT